MTKLMQEAPLTLKAHFAADLMRPNPVSVQEDASIREAIRLLTDKGFTAAPVIDDAGRPVGVISQSDILVHDRERVEYLAPAVEYYHRSELHTPRGERLDDREFQVENVDRTCVADVMTPAVFSVTPNTSANKVVEQLLSLKVHRLFVVDDDGILVGVISTSDVLRKLV